MQVSHSRVGCFIKCPYQYKLRYIDKLKTLPKDDPQDALILGHALHTGIEKDSEAAINEYYSAYPIIDDKHVDEALKLEYWLPKIKNAFYERYGSNYDQALHEVKIEDESFIGFIDLLVPVDENIYDLYDFKYSNNVQNYMSSEQLHLYKYYFEKLNPTKKIRDMYFMFVPKCQIKIKYQNKTNPLDETIYEFRKRIVEDLDGKKIEFVKVEYNDDKVFDFYTDVQQLQKCTDYIKKPTRLCDWCEYKRYCQSEGKDDLDMVLPKNERLDVSKTSYMKGWIYGAPFSGKTTFLDNAPDPINLNTDGNCKYVTMQRVLIRDEITVTGRITKRKFAWEVLKELIEELEKGSEFKTVIVDLVEDTREMCRLYMYDKLGIQHESDSGYGKGWDIIKTEYLSVIRRLLQLDYNLFLVSHEDISKELTKNSGEKISRIAPNIQEAIANKLAGMVDFVARVIVKDDGNRILSFKSNEVTFGGGRLNITETEIPLNWDELRKVYDEAIERASKAKNMVVKSEPTRQEKKETESESKGSGVEVSENIKQEEPVVETATAEPVATETPEQPKPRTRKPREVVEEAKVEAVENSTENAEKVAEPAVEEKPVRRRRRVSE